MKIFSDEIVQARKSQLLITATVVIAIIAASTGIIREFVINDWLTRKENVACVPSTIEASLPFVYYQSAFHPVNQESKIKTFIEQYVHLTKDESMVDYHKLTNKDRYYDSAQFSKKYWTAMDQSLETEKKINMQRFTDSSETYRFLKENKVGWIFNIDTILVNGLTDAGAAVVTVRGEYQVSYDQAQVEVPHRLYGYKEVTYIVLLSTPSQTPDGQLLNKNGYYVIDSYERDISPVERIKLNELNSKFYMDR